MALEFGSPGMAQSSMRGKSGTRGGSTRAVLKMVILWMVIGSSMTNFHSPLQVRRIVKAKGILANGSKIGGVVEKRTSKPKSRRDSFADDEEDFEDVDAELNYGADEMYVASWDPEQKSYYYVNQATGESSWKKPEGRCLIGVDRHEKERAERRIKRRTKYEGGHALREVLNRRLGQFAGLREMGFQEGANDITQAQCERFCDWLEEKAEPRFWRRVLRNRTYGCVVLCQTPMEVLQDRYKDRSEIVEGMEQQQRLQMTRGRRVIGVIAYDKNITEAQCNEIVDFLLHHDSSKRFWREQLFQHPFGFVRLCSLPVEKLQQKKLTKAKIVQFMSTTNEHEQFAMPHELRSLMRKHFMDVEAEKKYKQRRTVREEGSIAMALRSRLSMSHGLQKIDQMAYEVSGATKLSQAESEAVCEILLQSAKTQYARTRLKRELKLHPYSAVKLFVTPAEQLQNICGSLKAIVEFLRENRQPLGL